MSSASLMLPACKKPKVSDLFRNVRSKYWACTSCVPKGTVLDDLPDVSPVCHEVHILLASKKDTTWCFALLQFENDRRKTTVQLLYPDAYCEPVQSLCEFNELSQSIAFINGLSMRPLRTGSLMSHFLDHMSPAFEKGHHGSLPLVYKSVAQHRLVKPTITYPAVSCCEVFRPSVEPSPDPSKPEEPASNPAP